MVTSTRASLSSRASIAPTGRVLRFAEKWSPSSTRSHYRRRILSLATLADRRSAAVPRSSRPRHPDLLAHPPEGLYAPELRGVLFFTVAVTVRHWANGLYRPHLRRLDRARVLDGPGGPPGRALLMPRRSSFRPRNRRSVSPSAHPLWVCPQRSSCRLGEGAGARVRSGRPGGRLGPRRSARGGVRGSAERRVRASRHHRAGGPGRSPERPPARRS